MYIFVKAIMFITDILFLLLVARALCSWLFASQKRWVIVLYEISVKLTEFIVAPCRKITSKFNTGALDLSLVLACALLVVIRKILVRALIILLY